MSRGVDRPTGTQLNTQITNEQPVTSESPAPVAVGTQRIIQTVPGARQSAADFFSNTNANSALALGFNQPPTPLGERVVRQLPSARDDQRYRSRGPEPYIATNSDPFYNAIFDSHIQDPDNFTFHHIDIFGAMPADTPSSKNEVQNAPAALPPRQTPPTSPRLDEHSPKPAPIPSKRPRREEPQAASGVTNVSGYFSHMQIPMRGGKQQKPNFFFSPSCRGTIYPAPEPMPGFTGLNQESREIVKAALNSIFRSGDYERPSILSNEIIRAAKFIEQNYAVGRTDLTATFGPRIAPFLASRRKSRGQSTDRSANNSNNNAGNNNTSSINSSNKAPNSIANNRGNNFAVLQNSGGVINDVTCNMSISPQQYQQTLRHTSSQSEAHIENFASFPKQSYYGNVSVITAPRGAPPEHFPDFKNLSAEAQNFVKIRLEDLREKRQGVILRDAFTGTVSVCPEKS
jgi:hypothetical protein